MNYNQQDLEKQVGIHFPGNVRFMDSIAMDAQPSLVSTNNSGIPSFLTTFIDPKLIDVLVTPMKAVEVAGQEVKKGDWTTQTAMFPIIESTGQVSSYGDYSTSGIAGTNFSFPQRQSYHYQVITQWGERELERAGLARIDYASRLNIASALTLNKYQNKSYLYGIAGLQNYGLLNDPTLPNSVLPLDKGTDDTWGTAGTSPGPYGATGLQVYDDVSYLYRVLQGQTKGLVDRETKMTLALSPAAESHFAKVTIYNVNVTDMIKKNFPNMRIVTCQEYESTPLGTVGGVVSSVSTPTISYTTNPPLSGGLQTLRVMQLIADEVDGQRTVDCAFTEKMRAHPIVVDMSSFKQKKSQGTWGAIIYRPFLIATMIGI